MYTKIFIYRTIDDWNNASTDYVVDGKLIKVENGIAFIQDDVGLRQYINLAQVFCLVEGI